MPVDELIAQLLARGDMNDDTVVELNRMLSDYQANRLEREDEDYVRALHAKLTGTPMLEADVVPQETVAQRLDGLSIEEWRDRALRAEADLADMQEAARAG